MAKTKTKSRNGSKDILRSTAGSVVKSHAPSAQSQRPIEDLLSEAEELLERSQPELALSLAEEAVTRLEANESDYASIEKLLQLAAQDKPTLPQALVINADIQLALGNAGRAEKRYLRAAELDPEGQLVSAEPWLQLAQLNEQGGKQSIAYFDKAIEIMKNEIEVLEDDESMLVDGSKEVIEIRRSKVADALCGMTEIYMTDLSWEDDAEQRCEQLITEAVAVCPERLSAGVLQTLASVRISQDRMDEARKALSFSMSIWKDIPTEVEDPARPDFASRVSLARLLMEVEEEASALEVLQALVRQDDQSVESWYLGGWCQVLLSQKADTSAENKSKFCEQARVWLATCLKLYQAQAYEDDRLREHAEELVRELDKLLGVEEDDAWDDTDDDNDEIDDAEVEIEEHVNKDDGTEDVEMT